MCVNRRPSPLEQKIPLHGREWYGGHKSHWRGLDGGVDGCGIVEAAAAELSKTEQLQSTCHNKTEHNREHSKEDEGKKGHRLKCNLLTLIHQNLDNCEK